MIKSEHGVSRRGAQENKECPGMVTLSKTSNDLECLSSYIKSHSSNNQRGSIDEFGSGPTVSFTHKAIGGLTPHVGVGPGEVRVGVGAENKPENSAPTPEGLSETSSSRSSRRRTEPTHTDYNTQDSFDRAHKAHYETYGLHLKKVFPFILLARVGKISKFS